MFRLPEYLSSARLQKHILSAVAIIAALEAAFTETPPA
jgi:hypothetical protein